MAITGKTVAVQDTATLLVDFGSKKSYVSTSKNTVTLMNVSDADVFLGGADVTVASAGLVLTPRDSATLELVDGAGALYAVAAVAGKDVNVMTGVAVVNYVEIAATV